MADRLTRRDRPPVVPGRNDIDPALCCPYTDRPLLDAVTVDGRVYSRAYLVRALAGGNDRLPHNARRRFSLPDLQPDDVTRRQAATEVRQWYTAKWPGCKPECDEAIGRLKAELDDQYAVAMEAVMRTRRRTPAAFRHGRALLLLLVPLCVLGLLYNITRRGPAGNATPPSFAALVGMWERCATDAAACPAPLPPAGPLYAAVLANVAHPKALPLLVAVRAHYPAAEVTTLTLVASCTAAVATVPAEKCYLALLTALPWLALPASLDPFCKCGPMSTALMNAVAARAAQLRPGKPPAEVRLQGLLLQHLALANPGTRVTTILLDEIVRVLNVVADTELLTYIRKSFYPRLPWWHRTTLPRAAAAAGSLVDDSANAPVLPLLYPGSLEWVSPRSWQAVPKPQHGRPANLSLGRHLAVASHGGAWAFVVGRADGGAARVLACRFDSAAPAVQWEALRLPAGLAVDADSALAVLRGDRGTLRLLVSEAPADATGWRAWHEAVCPWRSAPAGGARIDPCTATRIPVTAETANWVRAVISGAVFYVTTPYGLRQAQLFRTTGPGQWSGEGVPLHSPCCAGQLPVVLEPREVAGPRHTNATDQDMPLFGVGGPWPRKAQPRVTTNVTQTLEVLVQTCTGDLIHAVGDREYALNLPVARQGGLACTYDPFLRLRHCFIADNKLESLLHLLGTAEGVWRRGKAAVKVGSGSGCAPGSRLPPAHL